MPWERFVLGYHGCDESVARRIAGGEDTLTPSTNEYDWLGHGQYFWEDSAARALQWAMAESTRPGSKIKTPAVLGAVIDLGHCLNLIEVEYLDLVQVAHERLQLLLTEVDEPLPENTGRDFRARKLDCAVFEALHAFRDEGGLTAFETVRAFFVEGEPLYPTAGIRKLDHIQICVRNNDNIRGYFLPRSIIP
jgi:hypothetical protein